MILWRNIENYLFYHFDSDPRFPPFLPYIYKCMLGGNLGSLLYGDVSMMFRLVRASVRPGLQMNIYRLLLVRSMGLCWVHLCYWVSFIGYAQISVRISVRD